MRGFPQVQEALREIGARLVSQNRNAKYQLPNGKRFIVGGRGGDPRAEKNALHQLRRAMGQTPTVARIGERREKYVHHHTTNRPPPPTRRSEPAPLAQSVETAPPLPPSASAVAAAALSLQVPSRSSLPTRPKRSPDIDLRRPYQPWVPETLGFVPCAATLIAGLGPRAPIPASARRDRQPSRHGDVLTLTPEAQEVLRSAAQAGDDLTIVLRHCVSDINEWAKDKMSKRMLLQAATDLEQKLNEDVEQLPEVIRLREDFEKRKNALPAVRKLVRARKREVAALRTSAGLEYDWSPKPAPAPFTTPRAWTRNAGDHVRTWIAELPVGTIITTKQARQALCPQVSAATVLLTLTESPLLERTVKGSGRMGAYKRINKEEQQ